MFIAALKGSTACVRSILQSPNHNQFEQNIWLIQPHSRINYQEAELNKNEARVRSVFGKVPQPGLPGARIACMHGMYVCMYVWPVCMALCMYSLYGMYVCISIKWLVYTLVYTF